MRLNSIDVITGQIPSLVWGHKRLKLYHASLILYKNYYTVFCALSS